MIFRRIIFSIVIFIAVGLFGWFKIFTKPAVISPIPTQSQPSSFTRFFQHKKDATELKNKIKETVGTTWSNYSVLVSDYTSDFSAGINETEIFTAASVNKIPILAAVYDLSQKGEVDLDQIITLQQGDIQDYGTGSIRYDPPGTTYSVKTLAKLMIEQSDNTAAYLLANYVVSVDAIQKLVNSWGLTQTDMINNKTSNNDMALLMKKIATGGVANPANTQEMLGFFKDGDFEDRIPALLPKDVVVYHKIGTAEGGIIHDVGVVTHDKTKYYLGIFTTDVSDETEAAKTIAQVSKVVYDYMK